MKSATIAGAHVHAMRPDAARFASTMTRVVQLAGLLAVFANGACGSERATAPSTSSSPEPPSRQGPAPTVRAEARTPAKATSATNETRANESDRGETGSGHAGESVRTRCDSPDTDMLPVKWTDELGLSGIDSIEGKLKEEDPDAFGALALLEDRKRPKSCRQWEDLHQQGYEPDTTADESADGFARSRCRTLALLKEAKPATTSHLRILPWDESLLRWLPPTLISSADPERYRAAQAAAKRGATWPEFDKEAQAKRGRWPTELEVVEGDGFSLTLIRAIAWGDFNADHVDDVVTAVTNSDQEGSYSEHRLVVLTRTGPGKPFEIIESFGP